MDYGEKGKLARKFKVSNVTMNNALSFKTHSPLANMLRKAAIENGGVLIGSSTNRETIISKK